MTFSEFEKLTKEKQHALIEKQINKLSLKRKDPIISVIGFLRLMINDSSNNTSWNVYRFDYTIEELTNILNRLNNLRLGEKHA